MVITKKCYFKLPCKTKENLYEIAHSVLRLFTLSNQTYDSRYSTCLQDTIAKVRRLQRINDFSFHDLKEIRQFLYDAYFWQKQFADIVTHIIIVLIVCLIIIKLIIVCILFKSCIKYCMLINKGYSENGTIIVW